MIAESRQVAFTSRQWEAYQFVLKFHRLRDRAPSAEELGQGMGTTLEESANLIGALTAKGVLKRRVYHVLAIVPPSYQHDEFAEGKIDEAGRARCPNFLARVLRGRQTADRTP
jgi:hypothetical protein